jgi:uncharacterized protein YhbP (UPF0306 family)
MLTIDWNVKVKEALERTDILALSTIGDDGSWTSPVQFTYNSQLELSFLSMMDTKHVTNILKEPRVSVAIYKPEPLPGGGNLGLQIKGTAKIISGNMKLTDGTASKLLQKRYGASILEFPSRERKLIYKFKVAEVKLRAVKTMFLPIFG